jgi:hypothetical protein
MEFAQRHHRGRVRGDGTERAGIVAEQRGEREVDTGVDIGDLPSAASSGPAISSASRFSVTMSTPRCRPGGRAPGGSSRRRCWWAPPR